MHFRKRGYRRRDDHRRAAAGEVLGFFVFRVGMLLLAGDSLGWSPLRPEVRSR